MWIVICGDMLLFAFLFLTYLGYRAQDAAVFGRSQQRLNTDLAVLYTILLVTSSLFVALAVKEVRARSAAASPLVLAAIACGLTFAIVKAFEYHDKIHAGISPNTNQFFLFYFLLTGLHLLHLIVGLGVLTFLWTLTRKVGSLSPAQMGFVEGCACFWHMVDSLWIILFPLLYLVR